MAVVSVQSLRTFLQYIITSAYQLTTELNKLQFNFNKKAQLTANATVSVRQRRYSGTATAWWIGIQYPSPFTHKIPWKFERTAVQGHPRSMILVPIESACTTSY